MNLGMMTWISAVAVVLGGVGIASQAQAASGNYKLTPDMLQFQYMTSDGQTTLDCIEVLQNADSQDWAVTCGSGASTHKYIVHLWLTEYDHSTVPKQSFELLYWVTDVTTAHSASCSVTTWYHFREPSDLYQIQASASLEQDSAELWLTITPPAPMSTN